MSGGRQLPTLFIGSSSESLVVAHALQEVLHFDMEPTVWTQGLFRPSRSTLLELVRATRQFDLAVFIFSPEDHSDHNLVAALGPIANQLRRAWDDISAERAVQIIDGKDELARLVSLWNQAPLTDDRALLNAGVPEPYDEEFPRDAIGRVFAFLESVSDAVLSGRIPEAAARQEFGSVIDIFWPHACLMIPAVGPPDEFWAPLPQIAALHHRWANSGAVDQPT